MPAVLDALAAWLTARELEFSAAISWLITEVDKPECRRAFVSCALPAAACARTADERAFTELGWRVFALEPAGVAPSSATTPAIAIAEVRTAVGGCRRKLLSPVSS